MSCLVTLLVSDTGAQRVVRKGTEPRKPTTWRVSVWFVLPNGEKHTHSARVPHTTVAGLVPAVGQIIDGLVADHGDVVASAGWTAAAHGGGR